MLTHFVQVVLRLLAGAALATATASVVADANTPPITLTAHRTEAPLPDQTLVVDATAEMPALVNFDLPKVINPPKPRPKPSTAPVPQATSERAVSTPRKPAAVTTTSGAQAYARGRVGSAQFACLLNLWNRESGWNAHAENVSSGAYGIPQSLPGAKMASAGADWRTNPITQVNWGLNYIKSVYGTPCAAWGHSNAVGWY